MTPLRFSIFAYSAALFVGIASAALLVWLAIAQPWLGLKLTPSLEPQGLVAVSASNGPAAELPLNAIVLKISAVQKPSEMSISGFDILEEPDTLGAPEHLIAFFQRQNALFNILKKPEVQLTYLSSSSTNQPETLIVAPHSNRPLQNLPYIFWFQLGVGLIAILLGVWVALRRHTDSAGRFAFGLACVGLCVVSHSSAVYSTRELALPLTQFETASRMNFFGSLLAGVGLLNLFLVCPTRIAHGWHLWLAPLVIFPLGALSIFGLDGGTIPRQVSMMTSLCAILVCLATQIVLCWRDPVARVILSWLGISLLLAAFGFVVAIILPALNGQEQKISQGHAIGFVLVIYVALSIAVARYRLYDLPDLSLRAMFYVAGLIPLLTIDAALIYLLSFEAAPAFGLSLALVGLFYLPLRSRMLRAFNRTTEKPNEDVFKHINEVVLTPDQSARRNAYENLLQWSFEPLHIRPAPQPVQQTTLVGNGEALDVHGPVGLSDLRLAWAKNGRGLFSLRDVSRANSITSTLADLLEQHRKYNQAISEERSRINRDVHDNIGILLSAALHSNDAERKDVLIRQTLRDMREIIINPVQATKPLLELIADLRAEISELLLATDINLTWRDAGLPEVTLPPEHVHTIRALCREAANNIVKHSQASHAEFRIRMKNQNLMLDIKDDGIGINADFRLGSGIENLRTRVTANGGDFVLSSSETEGTHISTKLNTSMPRSKDDHQRTIA